MDGKNAMIVHSGAAVPPVPIGSGLQIADGIEIEFSMSLLNLMVKAAFRRGARLDLDGIFLICHCIHAQEVCICFVPE
eukprot:403210-Amphidinium_carterae.2